MYLLECLFSDIPMLGDLLHLVSKYWEFLVLVWSHLPFHLRLLPTPAHHLLSFCGAGDQTQGLRRALAPSYTPSPHSYSLIFLCSPTSPLEINLPACFVLYHHLGISDDSPNQQLPNGIRSHPYQITPNQLS